MKLTLRARAAGAGERLGPVRPFPLPVGVMRDVTERLPYQQQLASG